MLLSALNEDLPPKANVHQQVLDTFGIDINKAERVGSGTFATAYDAGQYVLKITKDANDFKNIIRARRINSPNVVKVHKTAKIGNFFALLVDKINGKNAEYSTSEWHALIYGDSGIDDLRDAPKKIMTERGIRSKVLTAHNKDTVEERKKLSELFSAIKALSTVGVSLDDFGDNIMDDGSKYVIIDLGM